MYTYIYIDVYVYKYAFSAIANWSLVFGVWRGVKVETPRSSLYLICTTFRPPWGRISGFLRTCRQKLNIEGLDEVRTRQGLGSRVWA